MVDVTTRRPHGPLLLLHPADFGGMGRGATETLAALGSTSYATLQLTTPNRSTSQQGRLAVATTGHALRLVAAFVRQLLRRPSCVYLPIAQSGLPLIRDVTLVLIARVLGTEVVLHLHGSQLARRLATRSRTGRVLAVVLRASRWLVLSTGVQELLVASGVPQQLITVVRNPAPEDQPLTPRRRADGVLRVGYLGAAARVKGAHVLEAAVQQLRQTGWTVEIVAAGPFVDHRWDRAGACTALGYVQHDALSTRFWPHVDVLAVPSIWEEGLPFVILEALQRRVPVLTSPSAGLVELVEAGAVSPVEPTVRGWMEALQPLAVDAAALVRLQQQQQQHWHRIRHLYAIDVARTHLRRALVET